MKFSAEDKKRIKEVFRKKLKDFGIYKPQAVFWNDEFTQYIRYKILSDIGDLNNKSILDVGCGLGDFSFYLRSRFKEVKYKGIDIVPEMIEKAKEKYPNEEFSCREIGDLKNERFDYCFASGVFSLKIPKHKDKYLSVIRMMYKIAKIGIAFNMLNINHHPDDELFAAYEPQEIETFRKTLSKKYKVVTGYLPYDFTIYLMH